MDMQVGDIFNHSGEHFIYANYKYLCKNLPEKPNGFVLASDIKIKLRIVSKLGSNHVYLGMHSGTC